MARPVVSDVAEDVFGSLGPWRDADGESTNWELLKTVDALMHPAAIVDEFTADDGDIPGWAKLFDPALVPIDLIGYSGQYVGVTIPEGTPEASARALLTDVAGWKRGRPDSIIAAAKMHLVGDKEVVLVERYNGSAYQLYVGTYYAETPDPVATEADIRASIPAGIILTYELIPGPDIDELIGTINAQVGTIDDYMNA